MTESEAQTPSLTPVQLAIGIVVEPLNQCVSGEWFVSTGIVKFSRPGHSRAEQCEKQAAGARNYSGKHLSHLSSLRLVDVDVIWRELQETEESTEAVTSTQDPAPRVTRLRMTNSLAIDWVTLLIERDCVYAAAG